MSYILIDRHVMAITHKHSDREVLAKLSWIECTNAGVTVPVGGSVRPLLDFSHSELKLIYKNATGADLKGCGAGAAQALMDMAKRMPDTVASKDEVLAQAACVMDGDKSVYRYVYGSKKPEELATLFEAPAIKVQRCEAEELKAAQAYTPPAPQPYTPAAPAATASANPAAHTSAAPAAQKPPTAPRTGGTRDTIFKVADQMWEAAGSPSDLPHILSLRKQIMVELEANHDIKKTTSSTALGDWQKQRLT